MQNPPCPRFWKKQSILKIFRQIPHCRWFGGVAVGGISANKKLFGEVLETDHLSHTVLPQNAFTRGMPEQGAHLADELELFVERYGA